METAMSEKLTCFEITLKNCAFFARHGVLSEEEVLGQRFFVDAHLKVAPNGSLDDDNIDDTVNYGEVFGVIERIVTGTRRYLIEALALDVAKTICREFPLVTCARITIRKPNAPVVGVLDYVDVSVCWPPQ
jgi:dihydroneopterin aldolase